MSDIKLKDVLKYEHSFCVLPFLHKHIDLNNKQKVCCYSSDQIDERRLVEIRESMLNNETVPECIKCTKQEQLKTFSERQLLTREYMRRYPEFNYDEPEELSYDLRYSNLCNLRCEMCDATSSSEWARYLGQEEVYKTVEPESIEINPNVKRMYLAGGEPFMIKSFSRMLENIENKDCEIVINTNATILTNHMMSALEPFTNVCFVLSIDGTGETIERIRTLCSWDIINSNIDVLRNTLNPNFMVNTVVQKGNIDNIPELAQWIDQQGIDTWHTAICMDPDEFHYKHYTGTVNWSDELWNSNCLKRSIQATNTLKKVYDDLCVNL
jgi:pyruvate-formate lyase-activating enzyme